MTMKGGVRGGATRKGKGGVEIAKEGGGWERRVLPCKNKIKSSQK